MYFLSKRLIHRLYLFYKYSAREPDDFWVFYYPISVYSMIIIFYVWGAFNFSKLFMIKDSKIEYFIIGILILCFNIFFFSKKRKEFEKEFEERTIKFNYLDFIILIYSFGGLLTYIASLYYLRY